MLVSIGSFSRLSRLSQKALRLYERQGLLLPAEVDAGSGYRRYHIGQLRRAEMIRLLRAADTPLGEIVHLLGSAEAADVEGKEVAHLQQRLLSQHANRLQALTDFAALVAMRQDASAFAVDLVEVPAQTIAYVRIHTDARRLGEDLAAAFAELAGRIEAGLIVPLGPPLCVHRDVIDTETAGDIEVAVPVDDRYVGDAVVGRRSLPRQRMASVLHRGPYPRIGALLRRLLQWTFENRFTLAGPPLEIYEDDPRVVAAEQLRTRLQVPVTGGSQ